MCDAQPYEDRSLGIMLGSKYLQAGQERPGARHGDGDHMLLSLIGKRSVTSICVVPHACHSTRLFATKRPIFEPLKILFCGSDEFSIVSLKALYAEFKQAESCISSIDVACRPSKPEGRGLKRLREVPIAETARHLGLPLHQFDTFRGWHPPHQIDLVVAVSFGLLVPPRILGAAKYGGLNVHPSLLPDLRGPAPLHHTLLQRRTRTGVTVQTLHPTQFDQGSIIAQTPSPGFEHGCGIVPDLLRVTATEGAALLLNSIRNGDFLSSGQYHPMVPMHLNRSAPKITPEDRHIDWTTWTADEILLRQRIVGPLWNKLRTKHGVSKTKRVIWSSGFEQGELVAPSTVATGEPFSVAQQDGTSATFAKSCDGKVLQINEVTFEGQSKTDPAQGAKRAGFFELEDISQSPKTESIQQSPVLWNGELF